jgi:hypothetical protein
MGNQKPKEQRIQRPKDKDKKDNYTKHKTEN